MRTNAGIAVIESSSRWMLGRTAWAGGLRGRRGVFGADGGPGQVEQVRPLGLIQLQRADQRVQHRLRDAAQIAPLQPGVVLDADPGQLGDLRPAQTRHPAGAVAGQPGLHPG